MNERIPEPEEEATYDQAVVDLRNALEAKAQVKVRRIPLIGVKAPLLNPQENLHSRMVREAADRARLAYHREHHDLGPNDPVHVLDANGQDPAYARIDLTDPAHPKIKQ